MDISKLKTDEDKAQGTWIKAPFSEDDESPAEFLIAYTGTSKAYKRALVRGTRKHSQVELKQKPELAEAITREAIADGILLDWRGVREGDKPLPCTRENKLRVLAIPEIQEWLWTQANEAANFRAEALAEDAAALKSGDSVAP